MTDFLDRLEADLRVAAEQRGRRRRRNPTPVLKALAAAAVIALLVAGVARLVDNDASERSAQPKPTATPTPKPDAIAFFTDSGEVPDLQHSAYAVRSDRARDLMLIPPPKGEERAADPSLGTVVLYRPGSEAVGRFVSRLTGIEERRPLTDADLEKLHFDAADLRVVAVVGDDALDRFFADPDICQDAGSIAGGELRLCNPPVINGASVFFVGREQYEVENPGSVGHWRWAAVSPDGKTILGQWSAECEVPLAALIPVATGKARFVTADESQAKGWTTDGRAIVVKTQGPCGGSHPGTYLVTPGGEATRIGTHPAAELEPSTQPRTVGEVIRAAGR
jgi:hypothetical protein